tara:strand:- start:44 stop:199 length:156 start_codon:yes stop_codon:yes gene_type:complete
MITANPKILSYAILNAFDRILIMVQLDKVFVFNEYKEWIVKDFKKRTNIIF